MENLDQILGRIDTVLKENKGLQTIFVFLIVALFLCGIGAIIYAICTNQFNWLIPPIFTTLFLRYPIEQILKLREKNIALATVPALIATLAPEEAAKEIQKLIEKLYGNQ